MLGVGLNKALSEKDRCGAVLKKHDPNPAKPDWQLGLTKVFFRENLEARLEKKRQEELRATIMKIQAVIMGYAQRKRYKAIRAAIIKIEAWWRMVYYQKAYRQKKKAAITLQSHWRG